MKNWNSLFIRQGFMVEEVKENVFDCRNETKENMEFLLESLNQLSISYQYDAELLQINSPIVSEAQWINVVDFPHRGHGEDLWFRPGIDEPKVKELDTYISGIVRQLNRLGFYTMGSCDGNGRRAAYVMVVKERPIEKLVELFQVLGVKQVRSRDLTNYYRISLLLNRNELLDLAEKLSDIDVSWLEMDIDFIKEQQFRKLLEELLMIPGVSGREEKVRTYVLEKLRPFVDHITVDAYGNVLAEKTYRGGHGPTILLNAHLDTVYAFEPNRTIVKEGSKWSSSNGILGADDRAGVAVVLHMAEHLYLTSSFSGKVKFIFTVEEECGLVGASHVEDYFLWNTDAAIVVDRRGNGDIVTSCGGFIPFCHPRYGQFFEEVASAEGLAGWAVTKGGSSDTGIWADHGIQSVNLSAGYMNEHTDKEYLNVDACYNTANLVKAIFKHGRELRGVLNEINREYRAYENEERSHSQLA